MSQQQSVNEDSRKAPSHRFRPVAMILGDSIAVQNLPHVSAVSRSFDVMSIGDVRRALANLDKPRGANSGNSRRLLQVVQHLEQAVRPVPDLVLVNCGLHDIKREQPQGPTQVPIDEYREHVEALLRILKRTVAHAAWVRTTPTCDRVHNEQCFPGFYRFRADVEQFNAAAEQVARQLDVPVISLDGVIQPADGSEADLEAAFCDHAHFVDAVRVRMGAYLGGWIDSRLAGCAASSAGNECGPAAEPQRYTWEVVFDRRYLERPQVSAMQPLGDRPPLDEAEQIVSRYLTNAWPESIQHPQGSDLPYLAPGATYRQLWDWDAYWMAVAVPDEALDAAEGSICHLLRAVRSDGRPPKRVEPCGSPLFGIQPLPVHAQFIHLVCSRRDDLGLAEEYWPSLCSIRQWFDRLTESLHGLHVWDGYRGNGLDNNPAVYGRKPRTVAGIDLAVWHQRENAAMAWLANAMGLPDADKWRDRADQLTQRIQNEYWDVIEGMFFGIDVNESIHEVGLQAPRWPIFLKVHNWASLFPLWAGLARPDQAESLRRRVMSEDDFLGCAGTRSHSRRDPIYNNVPTGNPSNWQGPVWVLSTVLTAYGLGRYGYWKDASELAGRIVRTLAADIETNHCLHEYYHGDTGQPVMKPGFLSWNVLASDVMANLKARRIPVGVNGLGDALQVAPVPTTHICLTDCPAAPRKPRHSAPQP